MVRFKCRKVDFVSGEPPATPMHWSETSGQAEDYSTKRATASGRRTKRMKKKNLENNVVKQPRTQQPELVQNDITQRCVRDISGITMS
jgi:hypothetical protein